MKINYNITGTQRKSLVGAISQELNVLIKYLGAPTFAYEVGGYIIDRNGILTGMDSYGLIADLQGLHGFIAVSEEYDIPPAETVEMPAFEDLVMTTEEELGMGRQYHDHFGEDGMQASDVPDEDILTIEIPKGGFTDASIRNLEKMVISKASLIKKALGVDELPIEVTDDKVSFPWFNPQGDEALIRTYTKFIAALCTTAKEQKRVTAKEKPVDNEKYAFRCFLLRLGFIGDEYKAERKILLRNLSGNSSFKSGSRKSQDEADSEVLTDE